MWGTGINYFSRSSDYGANWSLGEILNGREPSWAMYGGFITASGVDIYYARSYDKTTTAGGV